MLRSSIPVAVMLLAGGAAAQTVIADYAPETTNLGLSSPPGDVIGQTFTAVAGGPLGSISVEIFAPPGVPAGSVTLEVRGTLADGATPQPATLATASVAASALPATPQLVSFDLGPANVQITAGATYAFILTATGGGLFARGTSTAAADSDPYPDGQFVVYNPFLGSWVFQFDHVDLAFKVVTGSPADATPPAVSCSVQRPLLWPPNGELVAVGLSISAADDKDPDPRITGADVFASEAGAAASFDSGLGLQADRSGAGPGRIYLIAASASDSGGNVGAGCCTARVPHSLGKADLAAAAAQAAAAETFCNANDGAPPPGFVLIGSAP